jgi:Chitin synthase
MNPLELEMYHQIKNVIGVNPTFYEYLFMVDADTTVDPYSVNRLISACVMTLLDTIDRSLICPQHDSRQKSSRCVR